MVEVAAYHIAREALTNVVRHACASRCTLRLRIVRSTGALAADGAGIPGTGAMLRLEVCDNGAGLPARPRIGIGLTSMRERAAELGGACAIESLASGGTCVSACLPIAGEGSR